MNKAAVWALALAVLAGDAAARRHALLVGNNYGGADVDSLRFAQTDARRFQDVLTRLAGFDAADVQVLMDCDSAGLDRALQAMKKKLTRGPVPGKGAGISGSPMAPSAAATRAAGAPAPAPDGDDLFLFYYSGHSDRDALRLGATRFPLEKLRESFQAVPSQVKIGIFDACQSGMLTRFKGGSATRPISLESLKNVYGQVIIASSAMDERSQESDQLEGSVFTHHWLNGLRGSADLSGDRKVTLNEAYQYAYQMTIETTSRTRAGIQHPAYQFRIYGEGDLVLADLTQGSGGLVFGFRQDGKYLVVDKRRGSILADFYKGPDRELLISLPEGEYNVLKVEKDQWRVADVSVSAGRVSDFSPASLKKQAQVVNQIKGSLQDNYQVIPGPPSYILPTGPDRKWGLSAKVGEGTGILGLAFMYNLHPELQFQGGFGFPGPPPALQVSNLLEESVTENSLFALIRKYEGAYFFDTGLNLKVTTVSISDSGKTASNSGWEVGVPVHFGMEVGPRKSIFGTISVGYLLMLTEGGEFVTARTPSGAFTHGHTAESGLSFGIALGMYLF
ncbi:MAG: peptidase caspase catalytic subunit p20 [Fibrobacteres bacterium]|nr:peptidase caspase catalytic subunit p20 [Fibrobacterota bacterium]